MGLKSFFNKIGNGIRKAGRWVRDRALPAIGRIAKPVLNVIGMLPGKIGMIGKLGSAITGVLHGATEKIPNQNVRDKLNKYIDKGSNHLQTAVDRGKEWSDDINKKVQIGKDVIGHLKNGFNNQIKPAIPPIKLRTEGII